MTDIKEKIKALIDEADKRIPKYEAFIQRNMGIHCEYDIGCNDECQYWREKLTELYNEIKEGENGTP